MPCSLVAEAHRQLLAGFPRRIRVVLLWQYLFVGSPCALRAGWSLASLTLQPAPGETERDQTCCFVAGIQGIDQVVLQENPGGPLLQSF